MAFPNTLKKVVVQILHIVQQKSKAEGGALALKQVSMTCTSHNYQVNSDKKMEEQRLAVKIASDGMFGRKNKIEKELSQLRVTKFIFLAQREGGGS